MDPPRRRAIRGSPVLHWIAKAHERPLRGLSPPNLVEGRARDSALGVGRGERPPVARVVGEGGSSSFPDDGGATSGNDGGTKEGGGT